MSFLEIKIVVINIVVPFTRRLLQTIKRFFNLSFEIFPFKKVVLKFIRCILKSSLVTIASITQIDSIRAIGEKVSWKSIFSTCVNPLATNEIYVWPQSHQHFICYWNPFVIHWFTIKWKRSKYSNLIVL